MDWRTNNQIALDEAVQKVIIEALTDGIDPKEYPNMRVSYVPHKLLDLFSKYGTVCGRKGNTFSFGMIDLLKKCDHVLISHYKQDNRVEILNMAVFGISQGDGVKLGLLAKLAGASLRAEPLQVGKESWVFFESE